MKLASLTIIASMLLPLSAMADSVPPVESALQQWVEAVETGTSEDIVALYDKDAVMISTFKQRPMTKRKELLDYYKQVADNPDRVVEVTEQHPRRYGDLAINTGQYTLSYTQEGEPVEIPARFSFTYVLKNGQWMIVDHHSSDVPLPDDPTETAR